MPVSCFAPTSLASLPALTGLSIGVGASELHYRGRDDFVHFRLEADDPRIAGVFTKNSLPGEPVKWCQQRLPHTPRSIVIAAGNANVCTGKAGWTCLEQVADSVHQQFHSPPEATYIAMTGVIGEIPRPAPLLQAITRHLPTPSSAIHWHKAAHAIMTTDTFPKLAHVVGTIGDTPFHLCGIAKGSGMIAPNMATMLAFLFTDITISQPLLQSALREAVEPSFNAISVDSDTSTSDTVLLVSTGTTSHPEITSAESTEYRTFVTHLSALCHALALQVISDGEGITKRLDITINGAASVAEAKTAGLAIANSPLVKTAIHGQDANWGRIIMAVGKSGVQLNPDHISVALGEYLLANNGTAIDYDEAQLNAYLRQPVIDIQVALGVGEATATVWGNDLSPEYIAINTDYRS